MDPIHVRAAVNVRTRNNACLLISSKSTVNGINQSGKKKISVYKSPRVADSNFSGSDCCLRCIRESLYRKASKRKKSQCGVLALFAIELCETAPMIEVVSCVVKERFANTGRRVTRPGGHKARPYYSATTASPTGSSVCGSSIGTSSCDDDGCSIFGSDGGSAETPPSS